MPVSRHPSERWFLSRGVVAMAISSVCFAVMAALVRRASSSLPSQELVALRSLASMLPITTIVLARRVPLRASHPLLLILRGTFGYLALSFYFFSLKSLPLAEAVILQYSSPVFTTLLAPFVVGEKNGLLEWTVLLLAFGGVLAIVRPGGEFEPLSSGVGLMGALSSAMAYLMIRRMRNTEHPLIVVLVFTIVASTLALPGAIATWVWPSGPVWYLISGIALTTAAGQIGLTYALSWERSARAAVTNFLTVPLSVLIGWLLDGVVPDGPTLIGMALVGVSAGLLAVRRGALPPLPVGAGGSTLPGESSAGPARENPGGRPCV